mmetsp:Transcript_32139/g.73624  ORF Transcript_32139/g.73624 Transcript_32139/m.73624 type:complete len:181 (-) Transcript_32139:38-580(-)
MRHVLLVAVIFVCVLVQASVFASSNGTSSTTASSSPSSAPTSTTQAETSTTTQAPPIATTQATPPPSTVSPTSTQPAVVPDTPSPTPAPSIPDDVTTDHFPGGAVAAVVFGVAAVIAGFGYIVWRRSKRKKQAMLEMSASTNFLFQPATQGYTPKKKLARPGSTEDFVYDYQAFQTVSHR